MNSGRLVGALVLFLYFGSWVYIGFWAYYQKQMTPTWQLITFIPFGLFSPFYGLWQNEKIGFAETAI